MTDVAPPMVDPFRLRVLKAITESLKTITEANGYLHDLADVTRTEHGAAIKKAFVFRGRQQFGEGDPTPLVSVLEHPRALDAMMAPGQEQDRIGEWDLLIQGFVEDDPENPTDPAHRLVADVIACLAKAGRRRKPSLDGGAGEPNILGLGYLMPCVTKIAIGSPVVRPADGVNSSQAFFWLTLTLTLAENVEKPFD